MCGLCPACRTRLPLILRHLCSIGSFQTGGHRKPLDMTDHLTVAAPLWLIFVTLAINDREWHSGCRGAGALWPGGRINDPSDSSRPARLNCRLHFVLYTPALTNGLLSDRLEILYVHNIDNSSPPACFQHHDIGADAQGGTGLIILGREPGYWEGRIPDYGTSEPMFGRRRVGAS